MAKCKYCGKSSIFLKVTPNGLCNNCDQVVVMDIQNRSRIYNDSIRLIDSSENPDVVYSRIQVAKDTLTVLLNYETKGIPTINPVPSQLLEVFNKDSDEFLHETFNKAYKSLSIKLLNLKSDTAKRNHLQKFIEKIDEYIVKVRNNQPLIDMRQDCDNRLQNIVIEDKKSKKIIPDKSVNPSSTKAIKIREVHPAKLLFIEENSNKHSGAIGEIKISISMGQEPKIELIGPDEPSIIFKDMPVVKPRSPKLVDRPPYYPAYASLSPEQRWIYLNWLEDITEEIDIGYVFLYYYGLERNLIVGDFNTAFQEILLLRKIHDNKSFEAYSYNALLYSSAFRDQISLAQSVMKNESKNGIDNVDLLFLYRFGEDIAVEEFMSLARRIKGINQRYIKKLPDRFKAALSISLSEKFGITEFPISSLYNIDEIPMEKTIAFANISFPSSMRNPSLPNFLAYLPFLEDCSEIFSKAHELVKEDLIKERLIND